MLGREFEKLGRVFVLPHGPYVAPISDGRSLVIYYNLVLIKKVYHVQFFVHSLFGI